MPKNNGGPSKNKGPGFSPYPKEGNKKRAGDPPALPPKQWRVSGGGTRSKAPPPAQGKGPEADKATDVPRVWGAEEKPYWVIGTVCSWALFSIFLRNKF